MTKQTAVKIGKTVYTVIETEEYSASGFDYVSFTIKKANTTKTLIKNVTRNEWTLWSGRVGLPKPVTPEFV